MDTILDRIVAAGAPAVTEPRFYRLSETDAGGIRVELRELQPYGGSRLLAADETPPFERYPLLQAVAAAARRAHNAAA